MIVVTQDKRREEHKGGCNLLSVLLMSLDPISPLCVALFAFQTVTTLLISLMSHVKELITYILSLAIG